MARYACRATETPADPGKFSWSVDVMVATDPTRHTGGESDLPAPDTSADASAGSDSTPGLDGWETDGGAWIMPIA